MKMQLACVAVLAGLLGAGLGCGSEDEGGDPYLDEVFTSTHVELIPDGSARVVSVEYVTRREQFEQQAVEEYEKSLDADGVGEARQPITYQGQGSSNCSNSNYLRLYSATSYSGHVICFSGSGEANLNSYCYNVLNCSGSLWGGIVESYKAGDRLGVIGVPPYGSGACGLCEGYDQWDVVSNCGTDCEQGTHVNRGITCAVC